MGAMITHSTRIESRLQRHLLRFSLETNTEKGGSSFPKAGDL